MRRIELTQGRYTLVDNTDYEWLMGWTWSYAKVGYAAAWDASTKKVIYLHRLLNETPRGYSTDHINGDKLDNRRNNLRTCTQSQNTANRGLLKNNHSGYKGVHKRKDRNKWMAYIDIDNGRKYLGNFDNLEDAIKAHKTAFNEYFKEFARLV
jgi:hypothetical protein